MKYHSAPNFFASLYPQENNRGYQHFVNSAILLLISNLYWN